MLLCVLCVLWQGHLPVLLPQDGVLLGASVSGPAALLPPLPVLLPQPRQPGQLPGQVLQEGLRAAEGPQVRTPLRREHCHHHHHLDHHHHHHHHHHHIHHHHHHIHHHH